MKKVFLSAAAIFLVGGFFAVNPAVAAAKSPIFERGKATSATATGALLAINKPTGVAAGDVMIANIAQEVNSVIGTAPSAPGWSLVDGRGLGDHHYVAVLYKIAGSSEPANYAFTLKLGAGPYHNAVGSIVAFSGVDTTGATPFDAALGTFLVHSPSSYFSGAKSIVTADANAAVIMFGAAAGSDPSWSGWKTDSPCSLTELYDDRQGDSRDGASVGAAWAIKTAAGATGAGAAMLSSSERNGGILLALKPAAPSAIAPVVTLENLNQTYDGLPKPVAAATVPAGLAVIITYNGSAVAPTNAGNYSVTATVNDPAYSGTATGTLTIAKAAASIVLYSLTQIYDGTGKQPIAFTVPAGLTAYFTFNGLNALPNNVGAYAVVGTINNDNYQGTASGTLVITPKTITVTPNAGQTKANGAPDPVLTYTNDPLANGYDALTGALSRAPGEDVGVYDITIGTLTAGENYNIILAPAVFTITP
jgi:MBG domain/MBG domain (YGX type)